MKVALFLLFSLLASSIAIICNCNGKGYCVDAMCMCNYGSYGANCENTLEFYHADLSGANEVPPVNTSGKGYARASYDRPNNFVTVAFRVSGLNANVVSAHIHKAPAGVNGPVAVGINITTQMAAMVPTSSNWDPSVLMTSGMYVNVHTVTSPGGEVRGQLVPITALPSCPSGFCSTFEYCVSELIDFACYCLPGFMKVSNSCVPTDQIGSYLINNSKVQLFRFLFRDRRDSSGNRVTIFNTNLISNPLLSDNRGTFSSNILTTSPVMVTQQTCFVIHATWMGTTFRALRIRSTPTSVPILIVQFNMTGSIQLVNQNNKVYHSTTVGVVKTNMMNYISICYRPSFLVINVNGVRIVSWRITPITPANYIVQLGGPTFDGIVDEFFAYNENASLTSFDPTFMPGTH